MARPYRLFPVTVRALLSLKKKKINKKHLTHWQLSLKEGCAMPYMLTECLAIVHAK